MILRKRERSSATVQNSRALAAADLSGSAEFADRENVREVREYYPMPIYVSFNREREREKERKREREREEKWRRKRKNEAADSSIAVQ